MIELQFLNEFEKKALLFELKEYNIVGAITYVEADSRLFYNFFFYFNDFCLHCEVFHSSTRSGAKRVFSDFVESCKSELDRVLDIYKAYLDSNYSTGAPVFYALRREVQQQFTLQHSLFFELEFMSVGPSVELYKKIESEIKENIARGETPSQSLNYLFHRFSLVNKETIECIKNYKHPLEIQKAVSYE